MFDPMQRSSGFVRRSYSGLFSLSDSPTHLESHLFLLHRSLSFCFCGRKATRPKQDSSRSISSSQKSRTLYEVLGVSSKASSGDIKSAYYELSKTYHPDLNKSADAGVRFREISEAYETLGSAQSRSTYDQSMSSPSAYSGTTSEQRYREQRYRESGMPGFQNPYDTFHQTTAKRRPSGPHTGRTAEYDYDEHFRQHYEEARRQQHMDQAWTKMYREMLREQQSHHARANMSSDAPFGTLIFLFIVAGMIMWMKEVFQPGDRVPRSHMSMHEERERLYREQEALLRDRMRRSVTGTLNTMYSAEDDNVSPRKRTVVTKVAETPVEK